MRMLYKRERRLVNLTTLAFLALDVLGAWAAIVGWLPIGLFAAFGTLLVVGHLTLCITLCRRMAR